MGHASQAWQAHDPRLYQRSNFCLRGSVPKQEVLRDHRACEAFFMKLRTAVVTVAINGSDDARDDARVKAYKAIHTMSSTSKEHSDLPRQGVGMALENNSRPAVAVWAVHVVGVAVVVMVFIWSLAFRGGVAWTTANKGLIFNWHPILMLGGFVVLFGEGVLVYRLLPAPKKVQKIVHATVHGVAFLLGVVGVYAAFKYHNESGIANLYSLHSWFGMITIVLFGVQWLFGLVTFLYPGAPPSVRQAAIPWHVWLGVSLYFLAISTTSQGILEKLTLLFSSGTLGRRSAEAIFCNVLGLLVYVLGGLVMWAALTHDKLRDEQSFHVLV